MLKDKKIGLISLGCDKNRVDSEKALALIGDNARLVNDLDIANVVVINTCAFLESARKEAIETIFEVNALRGNGNLEKIIVTGCLPQKFVDDIFDDLVEVDGFLGFNDYDLLIDVINEVYQGKRVNYVGKNKKVTTNKRILTTPCHYSYLKIADGCNNKCTYCLIPKIRGKYVSTPIEELIDEVNNLGDIKELILVAQDVTRYGEDIYGERKLVDLIRELSKLDSVYSIRLLYCYPDAITDELIYELKTNDKLIKYIDIPLQHSENSVLKRMNRKGTREEYLSLIERLKNEIPSISIRSTFITGFPGETEDDFNGLLDFIKTAKLTNAGFFAYSREEDTPAYKLPLQIDEEIKQKRLKKLYSEQKKISKANLKTYVNKTIDVVCDGIDYEMQSFYGHFSAFAPEIDGKVYFTYDGVINQGETYKVLITKSTEYDLYGRVQDEFTE
ncbi:MAG: 30S ribosomal protein S12 methylthiotransferase RimO [Clostridiales bacterium]|nr:30S ribosomal protein S12 methylthiotransferase RimO [Clostridiales bacterium]